MSIMNITMEKLLYSIASFFGYAISWIIRAGDRSTGSTWPGEVALRMYPSILRQLGKRIKKGCIVIAGTNGKTTTAGMVATMLRQQGFSVLHNSSGANLINGIVSTFFSQKKDAEYAVFEVDENALPTVLAQIQPKAIVLLNLFRDQLDRYGEVDTIAKLWRQALSSCTDATSVVANGDDPMIVAVTENLRASVVYFGLENPELYLKKMQHATDSIYCPKCGTRLTFGGVYFSHLGKWACGTCGFTHPDILVKSEEYGAPIEGVYNKYNAIAAGCVGEVIGLDKEKIQQGLNAFRPAFGRMESVVYKGKQIRILLSKNPTGFNESIRTVVTSKQVGPILMVLNDRIPDGTDVSWIWDVDFELLEEWKYPIGVAGERVYDMAVRMQYAIGIEKGIFAEEDLNEAIEEIVERAAVQETIWILATYSAMLHVRKILTGKGIL